MILFILAAAAIVAPPRTVVSTAGRNVVLNARAGVNLSGCEDADTSFLCPQVSDVNAYMDMGFNAFRIPVRSRQLDTAIPKLQPVVAQALRRGAIVNIDLHDFLPLDADRINPLVQKVAMAFGPNVWIDYDNEPKAPTVKVVDSWVDSLNAINTIIAAARSSGVTNTLVVEWPNSSGNHKFAPAEKKTDTICYSFSCASDKVGGVKDPLGKTVLGPHRYYDKNKSGQKAPCGTTSAYWSTYLTEAEKRGYKSLIGETAWGSVRNGVPASCKVAFQTSLSEIRASRSVVGFTVWGGGRGWNPKYIFLISTDASAGSSDYVKALVGR